MRLTLLWLLLFGFVCSCAAKKKVSFPDEKFTAEQIYERRDELLKKVIRAEFYWWWGSGQCHVLVTGGDGTTRRLPVIYDGGKIPETNPVEWAKFQLVQHVHDENLEAKIVKRSGKDLPLKFCLRIDADVEVIPPEKKTWKNKHENLPELTLQLVHVHAIREIDPPPACEHYPPASAPQSP